MKLPVHHLRLITVCFLISLGLPFFANQPVARAQSQDVRPALNHNIAPDVEYQFATMASHGDPLAMRLGEGDDASSCRHYQSVNRVNGPDGTPYMILTRSGTDTGAHCGGGGDHYPGELLVVRMGSRPSDGEALGTNRLQRDESWGGTVPPAEDIGVVHFRFNGGNWDNLGDYPPYSHPGGAQVIGDVLVVPLEGRCNTYYPGGTQECISNGYESHDAISLIDVSNPEEPRQFFLKEDIIPDQSEGLGVVGVVHLGPGEVNIPDLAQGGYLFAMTWGDAPIVRFAYAKTSDPNNLKTIEEDGLILLPATWNKAFLGAKAEFWHYWQTMNFVRDTNGALYIIAAEKKGDIGTDDDVVGLFRVDPTKIVNADEISGAISFVQERHLYLSNPDKGSLDAASSVYVSPSGQLIFYTGPHDNETAGNNIELGELGRIYGNTSQRCGPMLRQQPFPRTVAEETELNIRGWLVGTYIEPWVSLYPDNDFAWDDNHLTMSFSDQFDSEGNLREDWNEFDKLGFGDDADALAWCGPPGSILTIYEDDNYEGEKISFHGDGKLHTFPNMAAAFGDDWHDRVSSMKIVWDRPAVVYSLNGGPAGATLKAATGDFHWKPSEAQGPFDANFAVRLCEDKPNGMCDTLPVTIKVAEVNAAPTLGSLSDQALPWGNPISFNATASDSDIPVNTLSFSLASAPQGASIDASIGAFSWTPTKEQIGAHVITIKVCDNGAPVLCAENTFTATVEQRATAIALSGDTAGQYSDQVHLSAALSDGAGGVGVADKEITFTIGGQSVKATTNAQGLAQVSLTLNQPANAYQVTAAFVGDSAYIATNASAPFNITPEEATVGFAAANTAAEQVAQPGGTSAAFTLVATVQETAPDEPSSAAAAGDISKAQLTMQLVPLGPGNPVTGTCTPGVVSGATLSVNCNFNAVPVNTYSVVATVGGGYYAGSADSVVTIFDPSLGSASGGGWFFWPGSAGAERTNISFTAKYNQNESNPQVNFQLMRHSADGGMYRLRSTSLQGLSMGQNSNGTMGWATFTGKATYQEPGWNAPRDNYSFTVYVEDRDDSADRFWVEIRDAQGAIVANVSLSRTPEANALNLEGGNIRVPHARR